MNQSQKIRKATFAGSWYNGISKLLEKELQTYLDKVAQNIQNIQKLKALISPHAGLQYCGAVQAWSYKYINPQNVQRIFLLGPSHRVYMEGCGLSNMNVFETPFGNIQIDTEIINELHQNNKNLFEKLDPETEQNEHSLELQLPILKKIMGDKQFTLIPIMVGQTTQQLEAQYGKIFSKYFDDDNNLFIISSDFCHWGQRFKYTYYDQSKGQIYQSIENLDKEGMKCIEQQSSENFTNYLNQTKNTICGRRGINIFLNIIENSKHKNQLKTQFIQYAQSSQVTDIRDSSVSYATCITYI